MSKLLKKNIHHLHVLNCCKKNQRAFLIHSSSEDLLNCICEICHNVLKGNIPLSAQRKQKLKRFQHIIRYLASKKVKKSDKKQKLTQTGGFLPLILPPLLAIASQLIQNIV